MTRYAIGDIQGCYQPFMKLINEIGFNPGKDTLYLVGDLVNRGPESLAVLQWIYKYQDSVITVLGNHDIYLLARFTGIRAADEDETIQDVIGYKNVAKLIDYLRTCPLVYYDSEYILVHAGIHPLIDFAIIKQLNELIQTHLMSSNYIKFIDKMYGNKPYVWNEKLSTLKQMKFFLNSCTRMRYLHKTDYALNYKYKGDIANKPDDLIPWFKVPFHKSITKKVLFGHWASLGFYHDPKFISLDTGCVWKRSLTAINLDNFEITQVINE